jgi:hypothetical protein
MPRLVPISNPETPALLALRRTLWQLAFVGIATAVAVARIAPQFDLFALWCVLVPLSALTVHFRQALLNLLQSHRDARRSTVSHHVERPQARRARGDGISSNRRPSRARLPRDPSQVRPLAR